MVLEDPEPNRRITAAAHLAEAATQQASGRA